MPIKKVRRSPIIQCWLTLISVYCYVKLLQLVSHRLRETWTFHAAPMNHDINNLGSIVYWLYLSWFLKAFRLSDLLTHMHIIVLYRWLCQCTEEEHQNIRKGSNDCSLESSGKSRQNLSELLSKKCTKNLIPLKALFLATILSFYISAYIW